MPGSIIYQEYENQLHITRSNQPPSQHPIKPTQVFSLGETVQWSDGTVGSLIQWKITDMIYAGYCAVVSPTPELLKAINAVGETHVAYTGERYEMQPVAIKLQGQWHEMRDVQ